MYTVVDLFAGAGGLSLGFKQTQKYDIKVAFENNPEMKKTYKRNHPQTEVCDDVCSADYQAIQKKYGSIDVVIGGPPCQGFSNANRQKTHAINKNNMLVKQYVRAVVELQPKAFVMENVSMLRSEVHRFYLEEQDKELVEKYCIPIKETPIHLLDSQYVFDGLQNIIQNKAIIESYLWDAMDYTELNIIYKAAKSEKKLKAALEKHKTKLCKVAKHHMNNSNDPVRSKAGEAFGAIVDYYNKNIAMLEIKTLIEPAIMMQKMLRFAHEIIENNIVVDRIEQSNGLVAIVRSYAVFDYLKAILNSDDNGYAIASEVLCAADYGVPQKRKRFVVMGIKKSISEDVKFPQGHLKEPQYRTVRDAISDLEDVRPVVKLKDDNGIRMEQKTELSELGQLLRDSDVLKNHIVTATTETAMERFKALKQGQNFHALEDNLKTNTYTDATRTQNTIYLRLNYDEPCGTVVNVRKSMWIHPTLDRAISIREAARLQTFPDSFEFCGSKDKQYQQVGNAVPPIMAKSIAKKLASFLNDYLEKDKINNNTQS